MRMAPAYHKFRHIMKIFMRLFLSSLICYICLATTPAFAQYEECGVQAFFVQGIALDETAATGTAARKTAIAKATKAAFHIVTKRVLVPGQAGQVFLNLEPADIFVDYIHIRNETALPQRYIAEIDICFNAKQIRTEFLQAGVEWSEVVGPPVLLLPIWEDQEGVHIWADNIVWLEGWRTHSTLSDRLIPFINVSSDIVDRYPFESQRLLARDPAALSELADRANALQIAWIYAYIDALGSTPELTMISELYNVDGGFLSHITRRVIRLDQNMTMAVAFDQFRSDMLHMLDANWRNANLYSSSQADNLYIEVPTSSIEEWAAIQSMFYDLPIITSFAVLSLSAQGAIVKLELAGSFEALKIALRAKDYRFDLSPAGYRLVPHSP